MIESITKNGVDVSLSSNVNVSGNKIPDVGWY
jgi:hypothetical protein